tara:strand:+ start:876 stop:1163 length:288 start_codon:yes stop_codon:yes gene_type:complete
MDGFYKALEDNDGFSARNHIGEVMKYADYLSNDIETAVIKNDKSVGVNDTYVSGVPVMKFNEVQTIHENTTNVLPGTIRTNRFGNINKRLSNRTL